ncbi:DUF1538 domain-containing protein [uncultured Oscillibacter sp.]|uniref:DUF1538 domain-containing protein n=1 Tax=uncultured Oscillibacter sp. TaxID=876091 RepID=UPI00341D262B
MGRLGRWRDRMGRTKTILGEKVREALASVLPITGIVLVLCLTVAPLPVDILLAFLAGAVLLIVGMGFFTLGAEAAMSPIGEQVGSHMASSRKLWVIVSVSFLIGVVVTMSEPDLQVLAGQVPGIPDVVLIGAVAGGVGVFLVAALLRILFQIPLQWMLAVSYAAVFLLAAFFVPEEFLAVAFDSGGVTTGPMTVPFIMALGLGVSSIRSDESAAQDSFGLVALCSVGPILAVLILAMLFPASGAYVPSPMPQAADSRELGGLFLASFPVYAWEVLKSLSPIAAFFAVFQAAALGLKRKKVLKIVVGLLYTYIGLAVFLTGVNVGFLPAGTYLGRQIAALPFHWILVPTGMLMGWFIVQAEPAVHVLNKQVEEITSGAIPGSAMSASLSAGVAVSIGLAMVRVMTGVSIFVFLVPGYLLAAVLSFFVPKIFTSIAFDSGGVASGPMTATFLLPFAMGACEALGGDIVTDAFGVVAMVAMTPLLTIQLLGLVYQWKQKARLAQEAGDEDIIDLAY